MATYTVTGHALNMSNLGLTSTEAEQLKALLQITGVGASVTVTLSGAGDTAAKGHGCLK